MSLLDDLLRLQAEIRALEELETERKLTEPVVNGAHGGYGGSPDDRTRSSANIGYGEPTTIGGRQYNSTSKASIPKGTTIVTSGQQDTGEKIWVDAPKNQQKQADSKPRCTNSVECYEDPPCYGNHDCGECEQCLNWECVEKDWNRPCRTDRDCPCPPSEEQQFMCVDEACLLTCKENPDCGILGSGQGTWNEDLPVTDEEGNEIPVEEQEPEPCYACNQATGFCGIGCTTDETCVPGSEDEAADSKPGSYCVGCECITPCEPPRFCTGGGQCREGEYCAPHFCRVPGEEAVNTGAACAPGCDEADPCDPVEVWDYDEETEQDVLVARRIPRCVNNECLLWCESTEECLDDEECDDNECKVVGEICIFDSDCPAKKFCNDDGRCANGCRSDEDCDEVCPRDRNCVNKCPIDPGCTCEEITGGACEEGNYEWMQYCKKDPKCVEKCPITTDCVEDRTRSCVEHSCVKKCASLKGCPDGYACSFIDKKRPDLGKECVAATSDDETEVDDRFGCDCGECCTQAGQCYPATCVADEECEDCSYCKKGQCVPGCDEENPCPKGECCQDYDGKCHLTCGTDADCPADEQCLEGGCCGQACDPLVPCPGGIDDCQPGQFCNQEFYCEDGCREDEHCNHEFPIDIEEGIEIEGFICWQTVCELGCETDEHCNRNGKCLDAEDCSEDETCRNGYCVIDQKLWDQVCNEDKYCEGKPTPTCKNDNDCPPVEVQVRDEDENPVIDAEGNSVTTFVDQYCFDKQCRNGCRVNKDCAKGFVCAENKCEYPCTSNRDCKTSGNGNTCVGDPDARSGANKKWNKCLAQLEDLENDKYTPNWQIDEKREECAQLKEVAQKAAGYCREVDEPVSAPGGRTGCECWETCNELGQCFPDPCANDSDCSDCGVSCLTSKTLDDYYPPKTGRFCGLCYSDNDCPGRSICDQPKNEDGSIQKDEETGKPAGGLCAYNCIPEEPCQSNTDCPPRNFCLILSEDGGECMIGCQNSSECVKDETCVDGKCRQRCGGPDRPCPEAHSCKKGGCVYTGYKCGRNEDGDWDDGECPPELAWCKGGRCVPDSRCERDSDCGGSTKCVDGECDERTDDPYQDQFSESISVGCEACSDYCNPDKFLCECIPCVDNIDCPCGFCNADGCCQEECEKDTDCPRRGFCIEGECKECKQDSNCLTKYKQGLLADGDNFAGEEGYEWAEQLVCKDNMCQTPCGGTTSDDGDCYDGILWGQDCSSCPDRCVEGATCNEVEVVDSEAKRWDPVSQDWYYYPVYREECQQECDCDADCKTDTAWCLPDPRDGVKRCTMDIPPCVTNADCPGRKAPNVCGEESCGCDDDIEFRCIEGQCEEVGDECFTNSDCEPGELCDLGVCMPGDCSSEVGCAEGYNCVENKCRPACDEPPISCGLVPIIEEIDGVEYVIGEEEKMCPPGYNCDVDVCISVDYLGIGERMGCSQGKFCSNKGCFDVKPGKFECKNDEHCQDAPQRAAYGNCRNKYTLGTSDFWSCVDDLASASDYFCEENLCKRGKKECDEETGECETEEDDIDDDEGKNCTGDDCEDPCEKIDKCCNDQGFCEQCLCDEDHPCKNGECCDAETGKCFKRTDHPDTKYGAPHECTFAEVFCELIDPEEQVFRPSVDFNNNRLPGCEIEQVCNEWGYCTDVKLCYDGSPLSDQQIEFELERTCKVREEDCECDSEDEPPEFDECFYDTQCGKCQRCVEKIWQGTDCCPRYSAYVDELGNLVEENRVRRKVCEGVMNVNFALESAQAKAEEQYCTCLSDNDCTDCEFCDFQELGPDGLPVDGTVGTCKINCDLCPAGGSTSVKGKECKSCEEQDPCLITVETLLAEETVDQETGELIPAVVRNSCVVDTKNPCCEAWLTPDQVIERTPRQGCLRKEYVDRNGEVRTLQVDLCLDFTEGICAQCRYDSDCTGNSVCRNKICTSMCGQEDSAAMEQAALTDTSGDLLGGFEPQDCSCCTKEGDCKELYEGWTESSEFSGSQQCRPCQCTKSGIDCQPWNDCKSCYKWVRADGLGDPIQEERAVLAQAQAHSNQLAVEDEITAQTAQIIQQQYNIEKQKTTIAECAEYTAAAEALMQEKCQGCCFEDNEACCEELEADPPIEDACISCAEIHCFDQQLEYKNLKGQVDQLQTDIDEQEDAFEAAMDLASNCPQQCPPQPLECLLDRDCGANEICSNDPDSYGECVPWECSFDRDCPEGTDCVNGRCLAPGAEPDPVEQPVCMPPGKCESQGDGECCRWDGELQRNADGWLYIHDDVCKEYPEGESGPLDCYPPCDQLSVDCADRLATLALIEEQLHAMYEEKERLDILLADAQNKVQQCQENAQAECDQAVAIKIKQEANCLQFSDNLKNMEKTLQVMQLNLVALQRKLLGLPTNNLAWKEVRVCDCCIDGMCREDITDCAFGTCYMCPSEELRKRKPCYGAGVYGVVLKNPVCMGMHSNMLGYDIEPEDCPPIEICETKKDGTDPCCVCGGSLETDSQNGQLRVPDDDGCTGDKEAVDADKAVCKNLFKGLSNMENSLTLWYGRRTEIEPEIEEYEGILEQQNIVLEDAKDVLKEYNNELDALEQELFECERAAEQPCDLIQAKISSKESDIARQEDEVATRQQYVDDTTKYLEDLQTESDKLSEAIDSTEAGMKELWSTMSNCPYEECRYEEDTRLECLPYDPETHGPIWQQGGVSCSCSECPSDINDCSRVPNPGSQFIPYDEDPDMCIKYRCRDGLFREDRLPSKCWDARYIERCSGGIVSCALQGTTGNGYPDSVAKEYLNGWQFGCDEMHTDQGVFFGNASSGEDEEWIQFSGPNSDEYRAMCAFPNRLAHVRGHELPTFIDVVASHPCCNHGMILVGPDEEEPMCFLTFEYFFESGDISVLIERLALEIRSLDFYLQVLVLVWMMLKGDFEKAETDIHEAYDAMFGAFLELEKKRKQLEDLKEEKKELEEDLKEVNEDLTKECECATDTIETFPNCTMIKDEETLEIVKDCEKPDPTETFKHIDEGYWDARNEPYPDDACFGLVCAMNQYDVIRQAWGSYIVELTVVRDEYQAQLDESDCGPIQENINTLKNLYSKNGADIIDLEQGITDALIWQSDCEPIKEESCWINVDGEEECVEVITGYEGNCCRCSEEVAYDDDGRIYVPDDVCPIEEGSDPPEDFVPPFQDSVPCYESNAELTRMLENVNTLYDQQEEIETELAALNEELAECGGDVQLIIANIELKNEEIEDANKKFEYWAEFQEGAKEAVDEKIEEKSEIQEDLLKVNKDIENLEQEIADLLPTVGDFECSDSEETNDCTICTPVEEGALSGLIENLYQRQDDIVSTMLTICGGQTPECEGEKNAVEYDCRYKCEFNAIASVTQCSSGEIADVWASKREKEAELRRLEEEYAIPVKPERASYQDAKKKNKSSSELRKLIQEQTKLDEEKQNNIWYPGT